MKKTVLLMILFVFSIAGAQKSQKDMYLDYTNKVINYNLNIKNLNKIKSPFYAPYKKSVVKGEISQKNQNIKKRVKLVLLAVFDKKAYIKIEEFLGEELVKVSKKWLKINDKIYSCKLVKVTLTDVYFRCGNKILRKTLNKKIPMLGEKQ